MTRTGERDAELLALAQELTDLGHSTGRVPKMEELHALLEAHGLTSYDVERLVRLLPSSTGRSLPRGVTDALGPPSVVVPLPAHMGTDDPLPDQDGLRAVDEEALVDRIDKISDAGIRRCVSDLVDDWLRGGGRLAQDDFTRMTLKRGLDGGRAAQVLVELKAQGIRLEEIARDQAETFDRCNRSSQQATARDVLGSYLQQVGRYQMLRADDEVRLGRLVRAGQEAEVALRAATEGQGLSQQIRSLLVEARDRGRAAHAEMVCANLRLVVTIARQCRAPSGMDLIDLIQEGNCSLMRAVDKFDYNLGFKFSTYATWWIQQGIWRSIANKGRLVRLPVHVHEEVLKIGRLRNRLEGELGRPPRLEEVAEAAGRRADGLAALLQWEDVAFIRLDALMGTDDSASLGDLIDDDAQQGPAEAMLHAAMKRDIDTALDLLTKKKKLVLQRRFGLGNGEKETLEVIGRQLGVSRERIRQIEQEAMNELQRAKTTRPLYEYLVDAAAGDVAVPAGGWPTTKQRARSPVETQ